MSCSARLRRFSCSAAICWRIFSGFACGHEHASEVQARKFGGVFTAGGPLATLLTGTREGTVPHRDKPA
eukprot:164348-Prymnesium_polylepis.1